MSTCNICDDRLLTPTEVAEYRGISTHVLAQERCYGGGPRFIRDGRRIRYRASDLAAYIEASIVEPNPRRSAAMR
jgi:hypothetical protein